MKRKTFKLLGALLLLSGSAGTSVYAEEPDKKTEKPEEKMPVIEERTANLHFRYFDDGDETVPVDNAHFEVLQIAKYGTEGDENGKLIPLVEDIDYENETDASEYEAKVLQAYKANPDLGYTTSVVIKNGLAEVDELPTGAYLIRETQPAEFHIASKPFIASLPEMNETNDGWNFDVTVDPKPRISGHVKLKKVLKGDAVDRSDVFQFQLNIADGEYKATMSDGSNRTVKNGDVINLKADEEITIFNLPEQSDYSFKELNYDEKGYQPSYSKTDGKVEGKSTISSVVTNTKNKNVSTNVKNKSLIFMEIAGGALTVLIVLIALKKNSSRSQ